MLTSINLAYRFVVTTLMILHANYFCEILDIPLDQPMTVESVESSHIAHFDRFETKQYSFGFERGHLTHFVERNFLNTDDPVTCQAQIEILSHSKNLLDTNSVYKLSTNWLTMLGVNMAALERECSCTVSQRTLKRPSIKGELSSIREVPLPLFDVKWKPKSSSPMNSLFKCSLMIDGRRKRLVELNAGDGSIFDSSPICIRDSQLPEEDKAELEKKLKLAKEENEELLSHKAEMMVEAEKYFAKSGRKETPEQLETAVLVLIESEYNLNTGRINTEINRRNLLAIPDDEFLKMSDAQKSNLVKRFVTPESFPPKKVEVKKKEKASVDEKQ